MHLTLFQLTFHENLFYATREAGRLYETGRYLHNYALTYALGLAIAPYHQAQQSPNYAWELSALNEQGIYVTPARGVNVRYQVVTFKFANNAYHVEMEQSERNLPTFGRAKEIAVGSVFEFAVLHRNVALPSGWPPKWLRMGLWRSKALLEVVGTASLKELPFGEQLASLPLNPLDVQGQFTVYDLISMPPSSLVDHARLQAKWWAADLAQRQILLPANLEYRFRLPVS